MVETASGIGWLSATLLFAALTAWLKLGPGRRLQGLDGRRTTNPDDVENASRLLAIALVLSVVAAAIAVSGLMFG